MLGNNIGLNLCRTTTNGGTEVTEVRSLPKPTTHGLVIAPLQRALSALFAGGILFHATLVLSTAILHRER